MFFVAFSMRAAFDKCAFESRAPVESADFNGAFLFQLVQPLGGGVIRPDQEFGERRGRDQNAMLVLTRRFEKIVKPGANQIRCLVCRPNDENIGIDNDHAPSRGPRHAVRGSSTSAQPLPGIFRSRSKISSAVALSMSSNESA